MRRRTFVASLLVALAASPGASQSRAQAPSRKAAPSSTLIHAGRLIDTRAGRVLEDQGILVEDERIKAVGPFARIGADAPSSSVAIDLSKATVLPGLIDAHTHVLLQADVTQDDYDAQLLKESIPYRTIRATVAAGIAIRNGFTAIRDLETEGAMYADVDLKRAIDRKVIPGPRMFCATRAFAPTGMYPLLGYSWELKMPEGVQIVDGPDDIRKAVREQVKYGADWIKYYSDRRYFFKDGALHSKVNFTAEEAKAMVEEAHRIDRKVAAHAMGKEGIAAALDAGVDTIEHGDGLDEELMDRMIAKGVYWCPTIYVGVWVADGRGKLWQEMRDVEARAFNLAVKKGVKIAYGTDVGGYPWTENQAKEFSFMVKYGMTPMKAIQSATVVAADLLDSGEKFGSIEAGKYADIVATVADPLADISELERVKFVMKGGDVVRNDIPK